MKKSTIYSVCVVALSFSNAFSQNYLTHGSEPTAVTCTGTPERPIVGKSYTYEVTTTPASGNYFFWATKENTFVNSSNGQKHLTNAYEVGKQLKAISPTNAYKQETTSNKVDITWGNHSDLFNFTGSGNTRKQYPSFVAIEYKDPDCGTNNIKVYKVLPVVPFTLEIKNLNDKGVIQVDNYSVCRGNVKSAYYDTTADKIVYDYGEQKLYYEVILTNYLNTSTRVDVKLESGLTTGSEASLDWYYDRQLTKKISTSNTLSNGGVSYISNLSIDPNADPAKGVSVYLVLTVRNKKNESLTAETITLAIDGTTGSYAVPNVKIADCTEEAPFATKAVQIIKSRPKVVEANATGTFIAPRP